MKSSLSEKRRGRHIVGARVGGGAPTRPHRIDPEYNQSYTQGVKTAISVPDEVFREAERTAKRLGMSRSELFTRAMREFLGVRRDRAVTAAYDEAFDDGNEGEDARFRREAARRALLRVDWTDE
jgi:hypothetical protein